MIRWTSRIKFLFLLPAVLWVLAFTIFPLGYSLYLSFHDVERKVVITGREQVPVVDDAGNVVLEAGRHAAHQDGGEPRASDHLHLERARQLRPRVSAMPRCTRRCR